MSPWRIKLKLYPLSPEKFMNAKNLANSFQGISGLPKTKVKSQVNSLSHVQLFETPWTVARQAPLSMEFSRQDYWNGLPFPSPGYLPYPGIEPWSPPALQADSLPSELPEKPRISKLS